MLALVPVKTFKAAKQRLSAMLTAVEREALSAAMLSDVLSVLTSHGGIARVVICAADSAVETLAHRFGADYLDESQFRCSGLNPVVNAAARLFEHEGIGELLVVHGDLPLLSHDELGRLVEAHQSAAERGITLVPDKRREGTNLLAWNPATAFRTRYGAGSFRKHCDHARELGIPTNICLLPGAGLDIDEPDDLLQLALSGDAGVAPATRDFLRHNTALRQLLASTDTHKIHTERVRA